MESDVWPSEDKQFLPGLTQSWTRAIALRAERKAEHAHKWRLDCGIVWCTVPGCYSAWVLPW